MDREAWHAAFHGVAKSRTWLRDWTEPNRLLKIRWWWQQREHLQMNLHLSFRCFGAGSQWISRFSWYSKYQFWKNTNFQDARMLLNRHSAQTPVWLPECSPKWGENPSSPALGCLAALFLILSKLHSKEKEWLLTPSTTGMNLTYILLSQSSPNQKATHCWLHLLYFPENPKP